MAVDLISKDILTNHCEFSYDDWDTDGDKLPTMNSSGKDKLSTIHCCAQGSLGIGTDGTMMILRGKDNTWIDY